MGKNHPSDEPLLRSPGQDFSHGSDGWVLFHNNRQRLRLLNPPFALRTLRVYEELLQEKGSNQSQS